MSKTPQGIKKNTNPEEVTSKKLSRDPCGIGTCVIGLFLELIQYGSIQPVIMVSDNSPKLRMRLKSKRKLLKYSLKVMALNEPDCS